MSMIAAILFLHERPGPRGFDPRLNPYGTTETRPATTADDRFDPSHTTVRVELLMETDGAALGAQQWSQKFADLGYPARIRRPIPGDKPEVSESTRGTLRTVTVVGMLDRHGAINFPDRRFTRDEAGGLKQWLDENMPRVLTAALREELESSEHQRRG